MAKRKLSEKLLVPAIAEARGNLADVARRFSVTRQSVWYYVNQRPALKAACQDQRETMKDHAESALYKALLAGEAWAVCFFLKTQARDRGYVERTELTGAEGGAIKITAIEAVKPLEYLGQLRVEGNGRPNGDHG